MRPYTSVKDAIRDYKFYKAMFERFKTKQESLRNYIRENNLHNDAPEDIRMQIYTYRNTMRELQAELKHINKTIKKFDVESTERDIERQIRESNERMNNLKQAEVYDSDGNKYYVSEEFKKNIMKKITIVSNIIAEKSRRNERHILQ